MTFRIALITFITAALSAGGLMAKADTALNNRHRQRAGLVEHMSTALNLTGQQKQQAKSIFMSERETARPIREQLRQERKTVQSAIEAGRPAAEVQQLAGKEGPALANLAGLRAGAFAKFHAVLTPDQQQKLASLHDQWRERHNPSERPAAPLNR